MKIYLYYLYQYLLILSVPVLKKIKIILLMKILKVGSSVRSNRCLHTAGTVLLLSSKKIFFLPQRPQTLLQFVIDSMLNELMVKTVRAKWGETERCLSCHAIPGNCAEKGNSQKACQRYLPRSGEFWTIHVSLSLQIKQISTLFQSAKYTPQYYPTQAHCFIRYDCSLIKGFLFATNFNNKSSQWTKLAFSRQL